MGPGVTAKRTDALRSLIDLAPTILEFMGKKPLPQFYGQSLVAELQGREPPRPRDHIELELTEDTNNPERRALLAGNYKLLVRGYDESFMLFNLADDPGEEHNLAKSEPEKLAEMKALYKEAFGKVHSIKPFGGMKLASGKLADGLVGPPKK
jgi:arylsulfatase